MLTISMFLQRLKWITCSGGHENFVRLRIECYAFCFDPPLELSIQYIFIEYLETLDLPDKGAIVRMGVWLDQHDVAYRIRWQYCLELPIIKNVKQLFALRSIRRAIEKNKCVAPGETGRRPSTPTRRSQ